jgi:hypothetical protein
MRGDPGRKEERRLNEIGLSYLLLVSCMKLLLCLSAKPLEKRCSTVCYISDPELATDFPYSPLYPVSYTVSGVMSSIRYHMVS